VRAFYEADGDGFLASEWTRGPWDDAAQHGGPPAALLAGALDAWGEDAEAWFLARVTVALLRPVPLSRLRVAVTPDKLGRSVQRLRAALTVDGQAVLTASAVRIRRAPIAAPPPPPTDPWPAPDASPPLELSFFQNPVGYHKTVELRVARGAWGATPIGVWTRPRIPLVAGRESTAVERLVLLADAQSGMGVPMDPLAATFVNPDLTVYLERDPVGPWLGFDIRSTAGAHGAGLAQSAIRDAVGLVGRSAQSLLVRPR
jgi:hypothetical protein